jgi:TatA/E family protein of Tat protein translocase
MELLLIVVLALIVFGPAKLPEIMGQVGKAVNDFRRATSGLSDEFNKTIQAELQEGRSVLEETKAAVADVHSTVNSAVTGVPAPTRVAAPDETATATNGTSAEPFVEGYPETRLTNGTSPDPVAPPLADNSSWSWETSPAEAPAPGATAAEATSDIDPAPAADIASPSDSAKPAEPAPPAKPLTNAEHSAREDTAPPY